MRVQLIAIGNEYRRDDGVAHRILALLPPIPGLSRCGVMELVPEIAADIAASELVVFIDADVQAERTFLEPLAVRAQSQSLLGHTITPAELVTLASALYDFRGDAYLCHVPGKDFSQGEGLSPGTAAQVEVALELLSDLLRHPHHKQEKGEAG